MGEESSTVCMRCRRPAAESVEAVLEVEGAPCRTCLDRVMEALPSLLPGAARATASGGAPGGLHLVQADDEGGDGGDWPEPA